MHKKNWLVLVCMVMLPFVLTACEGTSDVSPSGNSDVGAPESVIGFELVQHVEENDGKPTTIGVGDTVTYRFVDANTILGAGLHTIPTTFWSYTSSGSSANVQLNYSVGNSLEELAFTSESGGTGFVA